MKIALYSRKQGTEEAQFIQIVIEYLQTQQVEVLVHINCPNDGAYPTYSNYSELKQFTPVDFMVSIGGDGSFIDAANIVGDLNIPLVGINTGRIGFLSGIKKDNFKECFQMLIQHQYNIEKRSLLHVDTSEPTELDTSFVINDLTIRATDTDSINAITVKANGQKINTYWADGLIIATPTGSTAYSMSCGGPILHPQTQVVVLTPIASHSLSVRPLVIPANVPLEITISGRGSQYALAVDTQRIKVNNSVKLFVSQENFYMQTVLFDNTNFYDIIREKLLWGLDKRNISK